MEGLQHQFTSAGPPESALHLALVRIGRGSSPALDDVRCAVVPMEAAFWWAGADQLAAHRRSALDTHFVVIIVLIGPLSPYGYYT
jgi:hypothetical protein